MSRNYQPYIGSTWTMQTFLLIKKKKIRQFLNEILRLQNYLKLIKIRLLYKIR